MDREIQLKRPANAPAAAVYPRREVIPATLAEHHLLRAELRRRQARGLIASGWRVRETDTGFEAVVTELRPPPRRWPWIVTGLAGTVATFVLVAWAVVTLVGALIQALPLLLAGVVIVGLVAAIASGGGSGRSFSGTFKGTLD
jgi:hypothetical protein